MAASLDILGGQGVQAHALVEALKGDGYDVRFIPINPRFPAGLGWLRRHRFVRTLVNQALYLPSLRRLRQADVVHVFSASYWSFLLSPVPAMLAARRLRKRVVLHYHSGEAEDHLSHWGRRVHPWLRLADEIVVPSEYLRGVFARHGYATLVIPNLVDTSSFRYRARRPLRPRLLSTRNFEPHYRVENTLAAFAILKRRYPQATLTLAGLGSLDGRLRRQAAGLGVEGIHFAGRVEPAAMPRLYDEADLFVNSAVIDNQPVSVLEAFAAGLPVISTGTGDIAAMVRSGETGLIVPADEPEAMAERARQEVASYTWSEIRTAWAAAYSGGATAGRAA